MGVNESNVIGVFGSPQGAINILGGQIYTRQSLAGISFYAILSPENCHYFLDFWCRLSAGLRVRA